MAVVWGFNDLAYTMQGVEIGGPQGPRPPLACLQ